MEQVKLNKRLKGGKLSNKMHNNVEWREENETLREYQIMKSIRLQERYCLPFRHSLKQKMVKKSLKNGWNKNDN